VSTVVAAERRSKLGRVPVVPWVRCADPKCDKVLAQRRLPWRGDPVWIQCRRCGAMNRVDHRGARIVEQAGDD
jgi:hypothetical protein